MLNQPSNEHIFKTTLYIIITSSICYFCTYLISTSIFAGTYYSNSIFGNTKTAFTIAQLLGYVIGKLIGALFLARVNKLSRFTPLKI